MSSQRRDFRRMLYRLDLATSYPSIPALIQHFMDETALDGVVEVKMVASPPMSVPTNTRGRRSNRPPPAPLPPLEPTTSVISFRREGRDVNAIALYGPPSAPTSLVESDDGRGTFRSIDAILAGHDRPGMVVKKRYPPRTTLVWVFTPLVQKLLDAGADTVLFEVRSYIAGADSVRESQTGPSPISPYGTSHSVSEPSPLALAAGSTPNSARAGSSYDAFSPSQYTPSPGYPVVEAEVPPVELHQQSRNVHGEVTQYEASRSTFLQSPVPQHAPMPTAFVPNTQSTPWLYPQSNQWPTTSASGFHNLQSLPPQAWGPSFSPETWSEPVGLTWQPPPVSEPYAYPAIPPLPWQQSQYPSYTQDTLGPVPGQTYLGSRGGLDENQHPPATSLSGRTEYPSRPHDFLEHQPSGIPATFESHPSLRAGPVRGPTDWQAQYPYLGALDIPPVDSFSYSPAPRSHSEQRETETSQSSHSPDPGSHDSPPPPSSGRESLTPTLTNPGYDRPRVTTPRQQWPFVPAQADQPISSAYTSQSQSLGVPGPSTYRSFSETIAHPRRRMRSKSPEPAPQSSQRGVKRLKVGGSRFFSLGSMAASPPPLSAGSSSSQPRSIRSRVSSTIASVGGAQRSLRTASPAGQGSPQDPQESEDDLMEILTRPAPYKRMLGYAARQHDGSTVAYELSDSVAATTGDDTLLGLGLSSVTNVAALGMELGRRVAQRQGESAGPSSQGAAESALASNVNVYPEHRSPQHPRGGDGWRNHMRGSGWQGCVVA